jgi:RhtB (resistance to homoserine/threonine) family protein
MMEFLGPWLLIASVNLAATMSPGPAFAVTVKNSVAYGRRAGILTACMLSVGIATHIALVLCGFMVIMNQYPVIYDIIRYAGAAYLFYLGAKALFGKKSAPKEDAAETPAQKSMSDREAIISGTLTSVLNPKSFVFFAAVYSQFVAPGTPWEIQLLYALTSILIEVLWFSFVAVVLTEPRVKRGFMSFTGLIERVCGGLLILVGIRLALSKGLAS